MTPRHSVCYRQNKRRMGYCLFLFGVVCFSLTSAMVGCKTIRPDGLYINGTLTKQNATVGDYCSAKGEHIELVRNNKSVLGIRRR